MSFRLVALICLLATTVTCRHELTGNGDRSVDRPALDLWPPDGPRADEGERDGPRADEGKRDGPRPDRAKDGPKPDASKSDKPKPDAKKDTLAPDKPIACGTTPVGSCLMTLLCGADGKWRVDCAKCGCPANGTCVNTTDCKVSLSPTADSFTRKTEPNKNFGAQTTVELSKYGSWELETAYLDFPVKDIPPVATITSAELKLYVAGWGGRAVDAEIRLVGQAWGETTINYGNAPVVLPTAPWSKETIGWGGNVLNVTPQVIQWLGAASTVHGFRLEAVDTLRPRPGNCYSDAGTTKCGYGVGPCSKENADPAKRPVLEITYK